VSGSIILGVVVGAAWLASGIKMDTIFSIIYDAEHGNVKADRGHVQTWLKYRTSDGELGQR
jgi:hypothetical protein